VNLEGLIVAFVGSLFVGWAQWRYGQGWVALVDVGFIKVEGKEAEFRRVISATRWVAGIGWVLIAVGFLLQMLAAIFCW